MTVDAPDIFLHIGAHKTATTHLQRSISAVRGKVEPLGVRFFGPPQLRAPNPTMLKRFSLPGSRQGFPDPQASLREMVNGGHRLVISEENLIGALSSSKGKIASPLYPDAVARLADLAVKIAPRGMHLCLGIRQPTRFVNSAYGQHLMSGGQMMPDEFKVLNPPHAIGWPELVDRLRETVGIASLTVWRQEDYRDIFDDITEVLLGTEAAAHVVPFEGVVHPGVSRDAALQIQKFHQKGRAGAFWTRVRNTFPVTPTNPTFDVFSQAEHAASQVAYMLQWRKIAAMQGVTQLRPKA